MPIIQMSNVKDNIDNSVRAKVMTFLQKLCENDTAPGLHIEPMQQAADPKARTGRVDLNWRAVLYRIDIPGQDVVYVYAGTWPHDEAIKRARTRVLRTNPVNGIAEFLEVPETPAASVYVPDATPAGPSSYLEQHSYFKSDLTEGLGFGAEDTEKLFAATSGEEILTLADSFENEWQKVAALGLAVGDNIGKIKEDLGVGSDGDLDADAVDDAERVAKALQHPASKMQFTLVEDNEELRRIIEGGDFGAWRVFLHPEQRAYAERDFNGAFRLTGGAGTGKTVVLLHRARRLANANPAARIVLTTYTKALSSALERDLERLDPDLPKTDRPGGDGILVSGIDALAASVKSIAGTDFWKASSVVFGDELEPRGKAISSDELWEDAALESSADLPPALLHKAFLDAEYVQIILPNRIASRDEYFKVRRPGRGVSLDRKKRAAVWSIVEKYRQMARHRGVLSYPETAAVAAAYLDQRADRVADHVLIDEAQDLTPLHWQLLRALVEPGSNDLFIAEDTHQRIYGHQVVLSRYGIGIRGRSRRLTLNYRTTQQNLGFALGVLEGGVYIDSAEDTESTHGYRSARSGPAPVVIGTSSPGEQFDTIADVVKGWIAEGVPANSIAVLARTNPARNEVKARLAERGLEIVSSDSGEPHARLPVAMTMHKSKGQEFSRVILFDVSEGTIPAHWALKGLPEEEVADVVLRERSLLYVAASRARDGLVIVWSGKPSQLLARTEQEY